MIAIILPSVHYLKGPQTGSDEKVPAKSGTGLKFSLTDMLWCCYYYDFGVKGVLFVVQWCFFR